MKPKDLKGMRFGRLLALEMLPVGTPYGREWRCICDCGRTMTAVSANLKSGKVSSCGCLASEVHRRTKLKHGKYLSPVHNTWAGMMARCHKKTCKDYKGWGGRGITVCERWHVFENFLADMGEPPAEGMSMDRIDNSKGYFPGNCRWATPTEQARNRRGKGNTVAGVKWSAQRQTWKATIGWGGRQLHLGSFDDWFEAVCARKSAEARFLAESSA